MHKLLYTLYGMANPLVYNSLPDTWVTVVSRLTAMTLLPD